VQCCPEHGYHCSRCSADAAAPEPPPGGSYHAVTVDHARVYSHPDLAAPAVAERLARQKRRPWFPLTRACNRVRNAVGRMFG
jgi:hypothetical protein